jgi:signal transduction histidine kinase
MKPVHASSLAVPARHVDVPDAPIAQQDAALSRFARHLAHDVNNYLAAILSRAELIGLDLPAQSPAQSDIEELIGSADDLRAYLRRVVAIAASTSPSRERGGLDARLADVMGRLQVAHQELDLSLDPACAGADTMISETRWRDLLAPLLDNARDAYARIGVTGGRVEVRTEWGPRDSERDAPNGVIITVTDAAAGIAPEIAPVLFEPLASTKRVRGAGLSLAFVRRLVHVEGGTIELAPAAAQGTQARLWFPDAD